MPWVRRNNSSPGLLPAALLLVLLCSCVPLREQPTGLRVADEVGVSLLADWQQLNQEVNTLQGIARARISSPEQNVSGTQVLLVERPERVRAESLSPFGTPLLTLTADGDELGVLLPTRNIFYVGAATAENLARFTRLPLKPGDLVDLLLYRVPLLTSRAPETYSLPEGGWVVVLRGVKLRQELIFSADRRLTDVRLFEDDLMFFKVAYSRFDELVKDFPAHFAFEITELATSASLDFSELALNRTFLPDIFRLQPPAGAIIHELDKD